MSGESGESAKSLEHRLEVEAERTTHWRHAVEHVEPLVHDAAAIRALGLEDALWRVGEAHVRLRAEASALMRVLDVAPVELAAVGKSVVHDHADVGASAWRSPTSRSRRKARCARRSQRPCVHAQLPRRR
eukprot:5321845-Prymnesium_polylepis.1